MTIREIRQRIEKIESDTRDYEVAHIREDELYYDFIRWIADRQCTDIPVSVAGMATAILKTKDLEFPRAPWRRPPPALMSDQQAEEELPTIHALVQHSEPGRAEAITARTVREVQELISNGDAVEDLLAENLLTEIGLVYADARAVIRYLANIPIG